MATDSTPTETPQVSSDSAFDDDDWDLIIEPHSSLLSLQLGEVWRYRDLLYLFTRRDIVSFYKQTILGPIWFFIQPIFTTLVYVLVFGKIAGLSTDGLPQILFYLCGITFWNYFSECFNKTATVFKDNAPLFGKVYFPRIISPLSIVISNLLRFAIQFSLFLVIFVWYWAKGEIHPNSMVMLFPIIVFTMAAMGLGFGMLFSAMTTKYRDMVFLLTFGVQLLMYATPVIYPFSQMPESVAKYLAWNPLAPLFEATRYGFLGAGNFTSLGIIYSVIFAVVLFLFSTVIFNRVERTFMDTV
ncbi:ABC transporter permease [Allorhodopirellula heiligendammensis]|uniref:Transport permease protein n=1 Tax=Allorhodopirellula heiligendammensis TaxID=2714739 RepID=A0A5C6BZ65_9BACT|nr:ABC transporter permease [Allorhodopirellula heiligendammensis]TWU16977.1 Teichoic acid translocation permease protein TagG [Allorhodopirellula heiligendammensis]